MADFPPSSRAMQRLLDRTIGSENIGVSTPDEDGSLAERLAYLIANQNRINSAFGRRFPFDNGAADITIAADTTWSDAAGFKRVGKLTINAGKILTIARHPFFILYDEIAFGSTSSHINGDGPAGASSSPGLSWQYAQGGRATDGSAVAQGGYGGGFLVLLGRTITGAAGKITVNGGAGFANATAPTTNNVASPGRGALDTRWAANAISTTAGGGGSASITERQLAATLAALLGSGGGASHMGEWGGSGGGEVTGALARAGGGSGIGGGGGTWNATGASDGGTPMFGGHYPSPDALLHLAMLGVAGGGGGAAIVCQTGDNAGGGGGGGAILLLVDTLGVTPTLEYTGGAGQAQNDASAGNGAAGYGLIVEG